MGAELFHERERERQRERERDRQTDRRDEANSPFSQFWRKNLKINTG